ncbi:MAG TPA: hypothetical protein VMG08_05250 [Allosphingosinicella sp.]|nr:hypothetical protein [Allosphingosinicella sp.]
MKLRLFALAAATAVAAYATPAAADPRGARAVGPPIYGGTAPPERGIAACRGREYQCGVAAFNYYGARQSLAWFQHGAREGSVPAMRSIGLILLRGEGDVDADATAAMGWFYEAALRGDGLAMRALADGFQHGVGVAPDARLASYWRERAATARVAQEPRFLRPIH